MCATHRSEPSLKRYQHGASILTAIFLITALAVLGALMTKLTIMGSRETITEWYSAQALYAAESGTDWAAFHILSDDNCNNYPYTNTVPVSAETSVNIDITCYKVGKNNSTINLYHIVTTGNATGMAQRQIAVQFIPTP